MSYDFARERYEASLLDDFEPEIDPADVDDEPSPYRSPYRCVRGDCGALDCSRCHPGNAPDGAFEEAE